MSDDTESRNVTPGQAVSLYKSILKHGEESWRKWIEVGRWVNERQIRASGRASGTTRGPIYAARLQKELGQFYPIYKKLSDNGTLSYLSKCVVSFVEVDAFRKRMDEDDRPNHPMRVWTAYEASLRSTILFADDEDEVDADDDDSRSGEKEKLKQTHTKTGHNREKELLAEIEQLREELDGYRMGADPRINADRIWRRLVETLGHDRRTGEMAITTAEKLLAIGRRITGDSDEWGKSGSE